MTYRHSAMRPPRRQTPLVTVETPASIITPKGCHSGTVGSCCAWQAEMQAAFATVAIGDALVIEVGVDDIDFDPEDTDAALDVVLERLEGEALRVARRLADIADEGGTIEGRDLVGVFLGRPELHTTMTLSMAWRTALNLEDAEQVAEALWG